VVSSEELESRESLDSHILNFVLSRVNLSDHQIAESSQFLSKGFVFRDHLFAMSAPGGVEFNKGESAFHLVNFGIEVGSYQNSDVSIERLGGLGGTLVLSLEFLVFPLLGEFYHIFNRYFFIHSILGQVFSLEINDLDEREHISLNSNIFSQPLSDVFLDLREGDYQTISSQFVRCFVQHSLLRVMGGFINVKHHG